MLEDLGDRLADNLPRLLVAFLLLIGGYAVSVAVAAMIGQSARKATGVRQIGLERMLRVAIMAAAVVVALTELGVDSSMLVVLLAVVIGTPALAIALLTAHGGRDVAGQIAAGRSLRHQLRPGQELTCDGERGTIVVLHPSTVELERSDGSRDAHPQQAAARRTVRSRGLSGTGPSGPLPRILATPAATSVPPAPSVLPYSADRSPPGRTAVHLTQLDPHWCFGYGSAGCRVFEGPAPAGPSSCPPSHSRLRPIRAGAPIRSVTCSATSSCWSSTTRPPTSTSIRSPRSSGSSPP